MGPPASRKGSIRRPGRRRPLSDYAYHTLLNRILTLELAPNDVLVEAQLAAELEVSRTPVREALALLVQEGLVEAMPRVGYRVTPLRFQDVHEVFDLRVLLEGEATARATLRASKEEIARIEAQHSDNAEKAKAGLKDACDYLEYHDEVHMEIAQLSGSERLARFIHQLLRDCRRLRMRDPVMRWEAIDIEKDWARRFFHTVTLGMPDEARREMQDHITQSKERTIDFLIQSDGGSILQAVGGPTQD